MPNIRLDNSLESLMNLGSKEDITYIPYILRYGSDLAKRNPKLLKRSAASLL